MNITELKQTLEDKTSERYEDDFCHYTETLRIVYIDGKGEYAADPVFDAVNTTDIHVQKNNSLFDPVKWVRIDADLFKKKLRKVDKNKEFLIFLEYGEDGEWEVVKLKVACSTFYAVYFVPDQE